MVEALTALSPQYPTLTLAAETLAVPLRPLSFFPDYNHPLASGTRADSLPGRENEDHRQERPM